MSTDPVTPRGGPSEAPAPAVARPTDPAAIPAALENVRAGVHLWLDRIEEMVRQWPTSPPERQAEGDGAERLEREWKARLEELERDRSLLAEAWERLEREQVEALSSVRPTPTPPRPCAAPAPRPASNAEDSPVSVAILRQFEALRDDVRSRSDDQHRGERP